MKTKFHPPPEIQVSYQAPSSQEKITHSQDAYHAFLDRWNSSTLSMYEEFMVIYCNRANHVLGHRLIGRGGISGTVVDPKIILGIGLKCNCSSIVIAHNHPSGNLKPSKADISITTKLKQACGYHDIQLLDHIILTSSGYYSFADEGQLTGT